ncbi:dystroglycan 1-like [Hydractinia symbiolongicarpus]|uniref:dystroglycan 1-like n=1 Tax=Hydractinia symbiolongicarpus TaxID=13093 RepID=UPI00254FBBC9|nr:dystroglycan 1-like [Hydractinia symbiolongicarpus]
MYTKLLVLLLCLYAVRTAELVPSWKVLQEKLHEKVEEIFNNDRTGSYIKIKTGKFFRYRLPGSGYEAVEAGSDKLPNWLSLNSKNNKLQGIPNDLDVQTGLKIEFRRKDKNAIDGITEHKYLHLDVVRNVDPFICPHKTITVASIVFHDNLNDYSPERLVKHLRVFSNQLDLSIHDLYLENGDRSESDTLLSSMLRMAGPGDKTKGEKTGYTVSWLLKCGYDLAGDSTVATLRDLTVKEDFKKTFKVPVVGWFITSTKSNRARRALGRSAGVNPTPSLGGTPTLGPSPSAVKPSPTKSVTMKMTSIPPTMPPVVTTEATTTTTEKVTTTTTEATTESTTESTSSDPTTQTITKEVTSGSTKQPTMPKNRGPVLQAGLGTISVYHGQAINFELPVNMFYDPDGDELNITFTYNINGVKGEIPVPSTHWIIYSNKHFYMLPGKGQIGKHYYTLTATDPSGAKINDVFKVKVMEDSNFYNNVFNATLELDYSDYNNSVKHRVMLVQDLGKAMSVNSVEYSYKSLRNLKFKPGSVVVQWGVDSNSLKECNNVEVQSYFKLLKSSEFKDAMATTAIVTDVGFVEEKECVGVVPVPLEDDDNLFTRILIPVIVILIILLIIAIILCCVYRRKRKYEPQSGQDDSYLDKKKPVIFLEEYDEKPDFVSLQPLILPHEKPPASNSYEPRAGTPDGPESSTSVSTESDERAPLAPQSPKDSQRKAYNAPPPYSAHQ